MTARRGFLSPDNPASNLHLPGRICWAWREYQDAARAYDTTDLEDDAEIGVEAERLRQMSNAILTAEAPTFTDLANQFLCLAASLEAAERDFEAAPPEGEHLSGQNILLRLAHRVADLGSILVYLPRADNERSVEPEASALAPLWAGYKRAWSEGNLAENRSDELPKEGASEATIREMRARADELCAEHERLEAELIAAEPVTLADVAIQCRLLSDHLASGSSHGESSLKIIEKVTRASERLAGLPAETFAHRNDPRGDAAP